MKNIKILTMVALCASSLTPIMTAPAVAQSVTTQGTMEATCSAALGANALVTLHDGSPAFSTEVVPTGSVAGTPTEVPGTRSAPFNVVGTGTFTLSLPTIEGDPYRVGGSVNMFGKQVSGRKDWSDSTYDFTADYATVTTYSYECHVTQQTETYTPPVFIPGHPVEGFYTNTIENGNGDCAGFTPAFIKWGEDVGACKFTKTGDATEDETIPGYWTPGAPIDRTDLTTSHTVDETTIAEDVLGHELHGGPVYELGRFIGQAVICISPSKTTKSGVPGAWQTQNGYTGTNCTTAWFNVAPWGAGSETSQGTYISVPLI